MTTDFKARRRKPRAAQTDVVQNQPAIPDEEAIHREAVIARHEDGRVVEQQQVHHEEYGDGIATHTRPDTVQLFKPVEGGGYVAKIASVTNMRQLFANGWLEHCPDCGAKHVDKAGHYDSGPNACKGREPLPTRVCPVRACRHQVYDHNDPFGIASEEDDEDIPGLIKDDAFQKTTPEQRTELKLHLHIWQKHPVWAQQNGVPQVPSAFRELVDQTPATQLGT